MYSLLFLCNLLLLIPSHADVLPAQCKTTQPTEYFLWDIQDIPNAAEQQLQALAIHPQTGQLITTVGRQVYSLQNNSLTWIGKFTELDFFTALTFDDDGHLWGWSNRGLEKLDLSTFKATLVLVFSQVVAATYQDIYGLIWQNNLLYTIDRNYDNNYPNNNKLWSYNGQSWEQKCTNLPKSSNYGFKRKDGLFVFHSPGKLNLYDPERCLLLESQPLISETLSSPAQPCQLASSNQLNQLLTLVNTKYDIQITPFSLQEDGDILNQDGNVCQNTGETSWIGVTYNNPKQSWLGLRLHGNNLPKQGTLLSATLQVTNNIGYIQYNAARVNVWGELNKTPLPFSCSSLPSQRPVTPTYYVKDDSTDWLMNEIWQMDLTSLINDLVNQNYLTNTLGLVIKGQYKEPRYFFNHRKSGIATKDLPTLYVAHRVPPPVDDKTALQDYFSQQTGFEGFKWGENGAFSITLAGKEHRWQLDSTVISGIPTRQFQLIELTNDNVNALKKYQIIYPNGDQQVAYYLGIKQDVVLPPDPAVVANPIDLTVASSFSSNTSFLYTGSNPIQTGVQPGTMEEKRVAVVRGRVLDRNNQPLPGVTITVHDHPEYGQTLSRADGMFDLAANGGGQLTISYQKTGYLPAHRQLSTPWQDYVWADDVILVQLDSQMTRVTMGQNSTQTAQSSVVTDVDGSRQATLVFPAGTTATMKLADGTTQPLSQLSVRVTEYTVGANGRKSMPASLPPTTAYTYAAEYSVDEALAAGATTVEFNQPVFAYVDNFLNFPVGTLVPIGWYDSQAAAWKPMENGLVIKILGVENGLALLDLDNSNQPATPEILAEWGITEEERKQLATSYEIGKTLWRARFIHFCPIDWNTVGVCPAEGGCPAPPDSSCKAQNDPPKPPCPGSAQGCILEIENQVVGETLPLNGASFDLNYRSNRVPGRVVENTLMLAIPNNNQDNNYSSTVVRLNIAGRQIEQSIDKNSAQNTYQFVWDGKDAYGRTLQGKYPISVQQCYEYKLEYRLASFSPNRGNFGKGPGGGMIPLWDNNSSYTDWATSYSRDGSRLRSCTNTHQGTIGTIWDARGEGLGGWTIDSHHVYAPQTQSLILGSGQNRETSLSLGGVINPVVSQNSVNQVAVGNDGTLYFTEGANIYRLKNNGTKETFVTSQVISAITGCIGISDLAVSPVNDDLYFTLSCYDSGYLLHVSKNGTLNLIAGGGTQSYQPGLKATEVALPALMALTIGYDGSIYTSNLVREWYNHSYHIYQINQSGIITTKLNNPKYGYIFDNINKIGISQNGDLYFSRISGNGDFIWCSVTRLTPTGQSILVPHTNESCFWQGMTIDKDDNLYLIHDGRGPYSESQGHRVWKVLKDGTYLLVAGGGTLVNDAGNNASATAVSLGVWSDSDLAISPNGILYISENASHRIRKVEPALPTATLGDIDFPSSDGSQIYHFNNQGKHLKTIDSLTGETLFQFNYDANGYLIEIIEKNGDNTKITRDANSVPKEIIAPTGQKTLLTLNQNGFLSQLSNDKQTWQINYSKDGLMTEFINPRGYKNNFVFDELGLITHDNNAAGGGWLFDRQINGAYDFTVGLKSKLGIETRYQTKWQDGNLFRTIFNPDGTQNQSTEDKNGISTSISPDGTVATSTQVPDPRFGMLAPLSNSTVKTPSGLQATTTHQRQVTLRTDNGLLPQTLIDTILTNGKQSQLAFDVPSKTILKQTPMGKQTLLLLDNELKKVVQKQITGIEPVFYQYDSKGRVIQITQGDRVVVLTYNNQDQLAQLTDALNRTISFTYDSIGQLTQQTLADGRVISYVYDSNGNLTSITPPSRPLHGFDYDAIDQQIQYLPPTLPTVSQPQTQYEYNLDKKLTKITRPDGQSISFNYDELKGRLKSVTTPNGNQTLSYDDKGRLNQITSFDNQALTYTYDGSLPLSETWNGIINGALQLTYNNDFKVVSSSLNGNVLNYQYDNDGLLTQVGDLILTRDAQNGLLKETKLGNLTTQRTHSNFAELKEEIAKYSNNELYHVYYTRDKGGRITQKQEIINGVSKTFDYRYDMAGRLVEVKLDNSIIETYQYDANGNRLNNNAIYDDQDRLLQYNSNTYTYSQNGDLKTKNNASFSYDVFGNLRSVSLPEKTIDYIIDARNRRVGKKVNGQLVQGFLYSGKLKPIAELDSNGNIVARFIYGSKINVPDYIIKNNKTYRVISDHLGSPRLIVDISDGSIAQQIDYNSFGNILLDTNPNFQPFAFAGGLYDSETGLIRFGARDYDPQIGRWTSKDPILFDGGDSNLFGYVSNDPVNAIDPSGLIIPPPVIGAIAGGIWGGISAAIAGETSLYNYGAAIAVGAAAGAASTLGSGIIPSMIWGAGAGAAGVAATQGLTLPQDDWNIVDIGIGGLAGAIGGGIGARIANKEIPNLNLPAHPGQLNRPSIDQIRTMPHDASEILDKPLRDGVAAGYGGLLAGLLNELGQKLKRDYCP